MPNYRELTAPDLVKRWHNIVNDNVTFGRDSKLIKDALETLTPVQILLGFYQYEHTPVISIPQFLRQRDHWIEDNIFDAELELAVCISKNMTPDYFVYKDMQSEESAWSRAATDTAKENLREWVNEILDA